MAFWIMLAIKHLFISHFLLLGVIPINGRITLSQYKLFKKYFIYLFIFRERGREEERQREKHHCEKHWSAASCTHSNRQERNCSLRVCPNQELDQQPLAFQDDAQPTEPHWSGHNINFFKVLNLCYEITYQEGYMI